MASWQRCRPMVLRDGDKNTAYFHHRAAARKRRNHISKIQDTEGNYRVQEEGIREVVVDYFSSLFSKSRPEVDMSQMEVIGQRVTPGMAQVLEAPYTMEEIKLALDEMHPCKSPGPDGFPALFYKRYWDLVGVRVCNMVLEFLSNGYMPDMLNYTYVVLIPKKKNPENMKDLRPISLCNVAYKLISKVLANRFKKILPSIIGDYQSAFVPGWLITDNVLVAFGALDKGTPYPRIYVMSCFKLPSSFCHELQSIISRFWWGSSSKDNGIHWKAWSQLCRPKFAGGPWIPRF